MSPRITTWHAHPPIPIRTSDWCATFDGREEDGPIGWGATEADAILNLLAEVETV